MSSRKASKNEKLSQPDTAVSRRQGLSGKEKIQKAGFPASDSSLPAPPQWEAPTHGLSRIAQLDKAKKEGAKYREQKEKEREQKKAEQNSFSEKRQNAGRRSVDSTAPELQFSQTLIDSFFEEREPIPPLSDEEKREIYRLVNEYYQEHPPRGSDYLVSGAAFICKYCQERNGSCKPMQILYPDHGVYADGGSSALLSSRDRIDSDTICGICPYRPQPTANDSNLSDTAFCKNAPRWFQTAPVFLRDGGRALTMDSYTICQYHPEALIVPISSGQEYMKKVWINEHEGNPIIIVPGIMGSRLYCSETEFTVENRIWAPQVSLKDIARSAGNMRRLDDYLKPDSPLPLTVRPCENQNYRKLIYAQGSVKKYGREYGAQDSAKALIDGLCDRAELRNRRIYFFSYDWRQSNLITAAKLREFIETLCQREGYEKVDLIGHSMGGLVISALYAGYVALPLSKGSHSVKYIDRSIRSKIGKIITLGTPYEGAPKLIQAVLTEAVLGSGRVDTSDSITHGIGNVLLTNMGKLSREIKSAFLGIAELIPTRQYVEAGNILQRSHELDGNDKMMSAQGPIGKEDGSSASYPQYLDLLRKIWGEAEIRQVLHFQDLIRENGVNVLHSYPDAFFFIGVDLATPYQLVFGKDGNELEEVRFDEDDFGKNKKGDAEKTEEEKIEDREKAEERRKKYWESYYGNGTIPANSSNILLQIQINKKEDKKKKRDWEKTCGDGTVPFFSSSMGLQLCEGEGTRNRFRIYSGGAHVKLSSESGHLRDKGGNSILDNIVNILLNGAMIPLEDKI